MGNSRGITLIELLIALSLVGIVISLAAALFFFGNKSFSVQSEQTSIVADARYTMDYLTRQIRKANSVEVDGNTLIVDSDVIELKDNILYNNNKVIIKGIDGLVITKNQNEVEIEITIIDENLRKLSLSSVVYIR